MYAVNMSPDQGLLTEPGEFLNCSGSCQLRAWQLTKSVPVGFAREC